MRSNIILFSCIFLIITVKSFGQVTFTSRPSSLQLYARQSADSASVSITGQVNITGYSKVIFTMFKNGILADSSISTLSYSAGKAAFAHTYRIHAEKSFYRFIMYTYNGSALQVMRADSVCSGDVYLINGQSNAIALLNTFVSDTVNTWVRSFGSNSPLAAECLADTSWGLAIGGTGTHHAGIGVWAYRLGKMIADSTGIPVCFVNGAKFGSRINEHLPIANHADVNSIYGRLYYRASKAKITASIKGLFWYQGESDGDTAYVQYSSRFSILYNSWKQDYPGLSKITVMQTRPGCIAGSTFIYHQQLREIQRTLAATYTDVTLTTTVAIPNFDGCHFLYSGYYQLAQQLYNQLSDDFYNKPAVMNSDPPRLLEARYTNNSNTELSLLFSQHVIYPSIYSGYNLKNYFYLNSTTTIISGSASGDTIKLQLSTSCNVNKITYLPTIYYSGSTSTYQGPWLVNTANVGVPSFYQFPINNVLTIKGSFCAADSTVLSTNRAGQAYQWYRNGSVISGANNSQINAAADGVYTLIMRDADSIAITSNAIAVASGKRIPAITSLSGAFTYCTGGNVMLTCDDTDSIFQWYKNGVALVNANAGVYAANGSGSYSVKVQDLNGCSATSSPVSVTSTSNPLATIVTTHQYDVCKDSATTLTANSGTNYTYQWQKNGSKIPGAIGKIYLTNYIGNYTVIVTNAAGCTKLSGPSAIPVVNPKAIITASSPSICADDTVTLTANSGTGYTYQWFKNYGLVTGAIQQTFAATSATTYGLKVTNNIGCTTNSPPKIITMGTSCGSLPRVELLINHPDSKLSVYPDPCSSTITLRLPEQGDPCLSFDLEITNTCSARVISLRNLHPIATGEISINTDRLASGIYFYQLTGSKTIYTGKIIKN